MICVLITSSVKMIKMVKESGKQVQNAGHVSGRTRYRRLYRYLAILVSSNLLCLIPIQSLILYSLAGGQIEQIVIDFLITFFLPLSSFTNPFLYTIKTLTTQNMQKGKKLYTKQAKTHTTTRL